MPRVNYAFHGTPWLESLGDYVISGEVLCAYQGKESEAVIPEGVTEISQTAFYKRKDVKRIVLPASLTELSDFLSAKGNPKAEVVMQEGLQVIGERAFRDNDRITELSLPESVTKISEEAFKGCIALTWLSIPASVKKLPKTLLKNAPSTVLHAPAGSYAEQFAKENNIRWTNRE